MLKTQEELNQLKTEYETVNNKLKELSEDELEYVTGGLSVGGAIVMHPCNVKCNLNPNTCTVKKNSGHCLKEGI